MNLLKSHRTTFDKQKVIKQRKLTQSSKSSKFSQRFISVTMSQLLICKDCKKTIDSTMFSKQCTKCDESICPTCINNGPYSKEYSEARLSNDFMQMDDYFMCACCLNRCICCNEQLFLSNEQKMIRWFATMKRNHPTS